VTRAVTVPGKPSSPSGDVRVKTMPTSSPCVNGAAAQRYASQPRVPPWSAAWCVASLCASVYVWPSSVKTPCAMRLPKRPMIAPKYGSVRSQPFARRVRHEQTHDLAAGVGHIHHEAALSFERPQVRLLAVLRRAERFRRVARARRAQLAATGRERGRQRNNHQFLHHEFSL